MCGYVVGAAVAVGHQVAGYRPLEGVVARLEAHNFGFELVGVVVEVFDDADAPAEIVGEVVGLFEQLIKDVAVVEQAAGGSVEDVVGVHDVARAVVAVGVLVGFDYEILSDVGGFIIGDDSRLVHLVRAYRGVADYYAALEVAALHGEVACKILHFFQYYCVGDHLCVVSRLAFIKFVLECLVGAADTLVHVGVGEVVLVVDGYSLFVDGVGGVNRFGEVAVSVSACPMPLAVVGGAGGEGGVVVADVDVVAGVSRVNAGVVNGDFRGGGALLVGIGGRRASYCPRELVDAGAEVGDRGLVGAGVGYDGARAVGTLPLAGGRWVEVGVDCRGGELGGVLLVVRQEGVGLHVVVAYLDVVARVGGHGEVLHRYVFLFRLADYVGPRGLVGNLPADDVDAVCRGACKTHGRLVGGVVVHYEFAVAALLTPFAFRSGHHRACAKGYYVVVVAYIIPVCRRGGGVEVVDRNLSFEGAAGFGGRRPTYLGGAVGEACHGGFHFRTFSPRDGWRAAAARLDKLNRMGVVFQYDVAIDSYRDDSLVVLAAELAYCNSVGTDAAVGDARGSRCSTRGGLCAVAQFEDGDYIPCEAGCARAGNCCGGLIVGAAGCDGAAARCPVACRAGTRLTQGRAFEGDDFVGAAHHVGRGACRRYHAGYLDVGVGYASLTYKFFCLVNTTEVVDVVHNCAVCSRAFGNGDGDLSVAGSPCGIISIVNLFPYYNLAACAAGVVDADLCGVARAAEELVVVASYSGGAVLDGIDLARRAAPFLHCPRHCGGAALGESAHRHNVARFIGQDGERRAAGSPVGFGCSVYSGSGAYLSAAAGADYYVFGLRIEAFKAADSDARIFLRHTAGVFAGGNMHSVVAGIGDCDGRFGVAGSRGGLLYFVNYPFDRDSLVVGD